MPIQWDSCAYSPDLELYTKDISNIVYIYDTNALEIPSLSQITPKRSQAQAFATTTLVQAFKL